MAEIEIHELPSAPGPELAAPMIDQPGAYRLFRDQYDRDPIVKPSLSRSIAKILLEQSPRHARFAHPRLNPDYEVKIPSREMLIGSGCHYLLFGQGSPICAIDAENYQTKAAKQDKKDALDEGLIPLLTKEVELAKTIVFEGKMQLAEALPDWEESHGDAEIMVAAQLGESCWLRCLIDWWDDNREIVVDYKTTSASAAPHAFSKQISRMKYDFQDAFYQRTIAEAFPDLAGRLKFYLAVQEITPPFALSVQEISEADRTVASRQADAMIGLWEDCIESDSWPGYSADGVCRIELPPWHHKSWLDEELEAEDGAGV
jgi:hypothetical protein